MTWQITNTEVWLNLRLWGCGNQRKILVRGSSIAAVVESEKCVTLKLLNNDDISVVDSYADITTALLGEERK